MTPEQIREAARAILVPWVPESRIAADAALAYAESLEKPIPWCFEHESMAEEAEPICDHLTAHGSGYPCDIAPATRPRRIE